MAGIVETVKELVDVARKIDNLDLLRKLADVQSQAYDLTSENRDLKEQNRELKAHLALKQQLVFRENAYWNGDEGPFCSRCFDAEGMLTRMHVRKSVPPRCPKCGTVAVDPNYSPNPPSAEIAVVSGPNSWMAR